MRRLAAFALVLVCPFLPALADGTPDPAAQRSVAEDSMLGLFTMKAGAELSEADRGYMKAMQAMQQALMKTEMDGSASGDFARIMIVHHQSAIDMIDVLTAEKDVAPEVARMAGAMRAAQAREIVALQAWLEAQAR